MLINFFSFLRLYITILCFVLAGQAASAQELHHSLEQQYKKYRPGSTQRMLMTGKYAQALFFNKQQDKAFGILNENIAYARKIKDGKYAAYLYIITAINYRLLDDVKAYENASRLAQFYEAKTKDPETKGYVAYGIGWLHERNNKEAEAVRYFLKALSFYEKAPHSESLNSRKASVYRELNSIYADWNDYELQEKYSKLSLEIAMQQNDPMSLFDSYMAMGYLYEKRYESTRNKAFIHQAESYYIRAVETYKAHKADMPIPSNLSFVAINLANLYLNYFPDSYQDKVLYYANLAKTQGIATGNHDHAASANGLLAEIALKNHHPEQAKQYLMTALAEAEYDKVPDPNIKLSIFENLSQLFQNENNFKEALFYQKAYVETFKQIYDQKSAALGKKLEIQYEREKQKQQLLRLQLASEKQEQRLKEMSWHSLQQTQKLENLELTKENQFRKLELTEIESSKKAQELRLSQLESFNRKREVELYKARVDYKEKINKFYIGLTASVSLLLILLLYAYFQRAKGIKQKEKLHLLEMEKVRQDSKISNLTVMLEGQEQERGRIARDLHDGLGSLLSGTKMNLFLLKNQSNDHHQLQIDRSMEQIDIAVDELRHVAHNLMPDLLLKYGLQETLMEYVSRMTTPNLDVDVQFLYFTNQLPPESQLLVYRIIQELVNNAVKHATAHQIIIQFIENESDYVIIVEDDGKGFDINTLHHSHSAGFHNIRSRVEFLKGIMQVESQINIGTNIEIKFPKSTDYD
ncbi:sensor histidine kinase [Chryseobacterium carnipullorum]|uniref:Sensor histidine kinase n=1 Tax=Chryseobacterium carnipullorum TaxID=1124835 RepID=A0A3G6ND83_CHRCU|nr:sensor histidine kinase [Chryseobacterium carnipullorum]AZA49359.1 sensor histidine kinase [Chryseobacterium carnipullorum]AZA64248.1 sensor histidine kinase [Chryseobacterium carnipullorum]